MLDIIDYCLKLARPLNPGEATHLRGYFSGLYADEVQLHHHQPDGRLLYDYPRVQFKVLQRTAHLIGIADGIDLVTRLWSEVEKARVGEEELPILEATLTRRREGFGESDAMVAYRFLTPWLGLNQVNHERYVRCRTGEERRGLLARILVGNCLAMAKSFAYHVQARLAVDAGCLHQIETRLKGVPMLAFVGSFRVNFRVPDRVGIGKSVSRGFGTVERVLAEHRKERECSSTI